MRQYGKRFVERYVGKRIEGAAETRDAVLVDIDTVSKVARVKVQGSDKLVTAHYPRNWFTLPYYMKIGNAVRITHKGGVRGYVEISGEGRAVPFAVSVTDLVNPTLSDGIISGLDVTIDQTGQRFIIQPGVYRIAGKLYTYAGSEAMETVAPMVMADPSSNTMGAFAVMGETTAFAGDIYQIGVPAAGTGYFLRLCYTVLSIGVDGPRLDDGPTTPDYSVRQAPVMPIIPAGHIQLCFLLLQTHYGGVPKRKYQTSDLNVPWTLPQPLYIRVTDYRNVSKWPCLSTGYDPTGDSDGDGVGAGIQTNPYYVLEGGVWVLKTPCPAPDYRITVQVMNQYHWPEWGPDNKPWIINGQMLYGSGYCTFGSTHVVNQSRGVVHPSSVRSTELYTYGNTEYQFKWRRDTMTAGMSSGYAEEETDPVFRLSLGNKGYEHVETNITINIRQKETWGQATFINDCWIQGQAYEHPVFTKFGGGDAPTQLKAVDP